MLTVYVISKAPGQQAISQVSEESKVKRDYDCMLLNPCCSRANSFNPDTCTDHIFTL